MRRKLVSAALLSLLFFSLPGFSQTSSNAQLTGIVTDQSGALIPGVTITVTKADTGVATTAVTNEAGVYNFRGLQPGSGYSVSASLPGFQTLRYTNLELSAAAVHTQNFQLQVATQATNVEVSIDRQGALTESSASVGDVLPEYRIKNLPLVGNNVLSLLNILPGIRFNGTGIWMGEYANTVAGQGLNSVNVTLDGLPTRDERFSAQAGTFQGVNIDGAAGGDFGNSQAFFSDYTGGNSMLSTTTINPDMVGEIRLILSPVDAELGRGNSQIQITSRSGTNRFTGSAVWNVQNTSLNPNSWNNNNDISSTPDSGCKIAGQTPPCWKPTSNDWRNTHQYTVSFGGPIIRNKTFFFALWDQQITNQRTLQTVTVLTDTARNGIYRFWEGYVPGDADDSTSAASLTNGNPTRPAVDFLGNPLSPRFWPDGVTPYDGSVAGAPGRLICFSVFGTVKLDGSPFTAADCPSGTDASGYSYIGQHILPPSGTLWDTKRPDAAAAQLGYFAKLLQEMPRVNNWTGGDGLNVSNFRWLLGRRGDGSAITSNALVGSAAFQNRKQINIKVDQNFSSTRVSAGWTQQFDSSTDNIASWPNGLSGLTERRPRTLTINATSTLSANLLNEGRFGLNINKAKATPPWFVEDPSISDKARSFILAGGPSRSGNGNIYPVLARPDVAESGFFVGDGINVDGGLMATFGADNVSFSNPLYNFADTLSWTHGKHAFKFGADFRFPRSEGYSLQTYPIARYGNLGGPNTESVFAVAGSTTTLGTTGTPSGTNPAYNSNRFPQTARGWARSLAYLQTNSLASVNTPYWTENFDQTELGLNGWQDTTTRENRLREMVYTDFALFAKDDYKLTRDLTLNLGVRYEYYAPPYITSGLTSTLVDQGYGLFGAARGTGAGFNNWLFPGDPSLGTALYLTGYGTNGTGPFTNGLGNAAVSLSCSTTAVGTFASRLAAMGAAPTCDPNYLSDIEFIGPNSPNTSSSIIPRDKNNFGPAVGFAWQVPWFGAGKTTVRGGYQVTFQRVNVPEATLASAAGGFVDPSVTLNNPNPASLAITSATGLNRAALLSDLPTLVPVEPTRSPGEVGVVYGRSESFQAYDPNYATPYTQNLTLSVTRQLSRNLTLDVKYVGSLSRKLPGTLNLNTSTVFQNQELFDAFEAARRGENPALLDELFAGVDIAPGGFSNTNWVLGSQSGTSATDRMYGPVGSCTLISSVPGAPPLPSDPRCPAGSFFNSGGAHLRRALGFGSYSTGDDLANGTYASLANVLAGGTQPTGGLQPITVPLGGVFPSQRVLRNGCDRIANGLYDPNSPAVYPVLNSANVGERSAVPNSIPSNIPTRCFPENYLLSNPQLNNATYNTNLGRSNFHSLQVQMNMRPVNGFSFQSTYTWAKSMGIPTSGYSDPLNRNFDRQQGNERKHDLRLNGTVELPIGPNKLLFGNTSGWVARMIERWQTSVILNLSSGSPYSVTNAVSSRYSFSSGFVPSGNNRFNPTEYWTVPKGNVEFGGVGRSVFTAFGTGPNDAGTFFGVDAPGNVGSYTSVIDPQCFDSSRVVQRDSMGFAFASDASGCTMRALAVRVPVGTPGSFALNPANPAEINAVHVLVNPKPGEYGSLAPNVLTAFGYWGLDANAQKSFAISESKQLTIRIDATNVLNHPQPFIPVFSTSTAFTQFGIIECGCQDHKSGTRAFQGQVRLTF